VKKEKEETFNRDLKKFEELLKAKIEMDEKYNDYKKLYALREKKVKILKEQIEVKL